MVSIESQQSNDYNPYPNYRPYTRMPIINPGYTPGSQSVAYSCQLTQLLVIIGLPSSAADLQQSVSSRWWILQWRRYIVCDARLVHSCTHHSTLACPSCSILMRTHIYDLLIHPSIYVYYNRFRSLLIMCTDSLCKQL